MFSRIAPIYRGGEGFRLADHFVDGVVSTHIFIMEFQFPLGPESTTMHAMREGTKRRDLVDLGDEGFEFLERKGVGQRFGNHPLEHLSGNLTCSAAAGGNDYILGLGAIHIGVDRYSSLGTDQNFLHFLGAFDVALTEQEADAELFQTRRQYHRGTYFHFIEHDGVGGLLGHTFLRAGLSFWCDYGSVVNEGGRVCHGSRWVWGNRGFTGTISAPSLIRRTHNLSGLDISSTQFCQPDRKPAARLTSAYRVAGRGSE